MSLTRVELAESSGLSRASIDQLVRFGLISGRFVGDDEYFDEDALVVARLAAGFQAHGIEARHLRMYKVAAEREAGLFEQVVMPLVKQREERSRTVATETVAELGDLGDRLRAAMLRRALRDLFGPG
ncbi:MAG: hypothetical protein U5R31_04315 [Acidimicrobiia bacterium]|nr:hypothetical protein [Acidimicrobiia bacterium]